MENQQQRSNRAKRCRPVLPRSCQHEKPPESRRAAEPRRIIRALISRFVPLSDVTQLVNDVPHQPRTHTHTHTHPYHAACCIAMDFFLCIISVHCYLILLCFVFLYSIFCYYYVCVCVFVTEGWILLNLTGKSLRDAFALLFPGE